MSRFDSYVICTTPRSGSTLLCGLLRETGVAGFPDSHFHDPSLDEWHGYYGLAKDGFTSREDALRAVVEAAVACGRGETDIFGLRMQRHSFDYFLEQLRYLHPSLPGDRSLIEAAFGTTLFVYLYREDKLDQAISYVKASQTGLWHQAPDGTELERLSEPREPVYDAAAIAEQLERSAKMEAAWEQWFSKERIEPLRVTYSELSSGPIDTLVRILDALGLDHRPAEGAVLPVAKLADSVNREWAERFRGETGN